MNDTKLLILVLFTTIMAALAYRSAAINGDKEVRTNMKFYPKHYVMPPRWVRKLFALPKREMARFLVIDLYLSLAHVALALISIFVFRLDFSWGRTAINYLPLIVALVGIIQAIVYLVLLHMFKHKKKS